MYRLNGYLEGTAPGRIAWTATQEERLTEEWSALGSQTHLREIKLPAQNPSRIAHL